MIFNDILGQHPCDGKISCNDGRCLSLHFCCNRSIDAKCPLYHMVPCCAQYLRGQLSVFSISDSHRLDNHYGEIHIFHGNEHNYVRSTVFTMSTCAVAVLFSFAILIIAVYRVHVRQSVLTPFTSIDQTSLEHNECAHVTHNHNHSDPTQLVVGLVSQ